MSEPISETGNRKPDRELEIHEQLSPNDEICRQCSDLGLPGIIPAGEEYKIIISATRSDNCCADCWNRLHEECQQ